MAENITEQLEFPEELKKRAREFFAKGKEVAYTLNYDYALELFLDGLSFWPDAVEEGHKPLRDIALRRQAAGGKKSGFGDGSKYKKASGKNPKDAMLKAEYLLSKDPNNSSHMTDMVKAALENNYQQTAVWLADLLLEFNLHRNKPSFHAYLLLRDVYSKTQMYERAIQVTQLALQLKPNDSVLENTLRDLSAQNVMQQGKYNGKGDFRESIKDREAQAKLQAQEQIVRTKTSLTDAIEQARQEYQANPQVPGKIEKLVKALCDTEKTENEKEAIDILEKAYVETSNFNLKQRSGEIIIKQLNRCARELQTRLQQEPNNPQLKEQIAQTAQKVLEEELNHYQLCVANYPTDMKLKFEYGKRLIKARQYDEAIPMFQEARNDPRYRISALNFIGRCFYHKQWYTDAVETFEQALELLENKEDALGKELRYNLGRSFEADGKIEDALNCYRKVAQIDFNYLDVRNRVDALRKHQDGNP